MSPKAKKPQATSQKPSTSKPNTEPQSDSSRPVLYPEVKVQVFLGEDAMTCDVAKKLLGWAEETEHAPFEHDYLLLDYSKHKVRCLNNVTNRPLYGNVVETLKQEHLRKKWTFNGEPIIVGKTGLLLNGQHTLVSLVLACQEWWERKDHWEDHWTTEPTMEKLVVFGVSEDDKTVNTMDTCKPRSLMDVVYRSEFCQGKNGAERKLFARICDYAIRLLWYRTGAGLDAFAPRRTHAESLDFLSRHPKLLACVAHVQNEDGSKKAISRYVSPGYAAGLLYLMGSSGTDIEESEYSRSHNRNESMLNWDHWEKAQEFIVLLAAGGAPVKALRDALAARIEEGSCSNAVRWGLLAKAWCRFLEGKPITEASLQLEWGDNADGIKVLAEFPTVGGIDLGDPSNADEDHIPGQSDPTPAEIAQRAAELKRNPLPSEKPKPKALKAPKRASEEWAVDDIAWVWDEDGEHYLARITEPPYDTEGAKGPMVTVEDEKGKTWEVALDELSLTKPGTKKGNETSPEEPKPEAPKPSAPKPSTKRMPSSGAPIPHKKLDNEKKAKAPKVGSVYWVKEEDAEAWQGKVSEVNELLKVAKLKVENGFPGCGLLRTVAWSQLKTSQPDPRPTPVLGD